MPTWKQWTDAIELADVMAVKRLRQEQPEALLRPQPEGNPLIHLLLQKTTFTRRRPLLRALLKGLPDDALIDRPEPLWLATDKRWLEAVERLLPLSNPNLLYGGRTPLMHASHLMGHNDREWYTNRCIEHALLWNSDPNVQDAKGWTVVMYAADRCLTHRMSEYLDYHQALQAEGKPGLNLLLRNRDGQTVEDLFVVKREALLDDLFQSAQRTKEVLARLRIEQERTMLTNVFEASVVPPIDGSGPSTSVPTRMLRARL